MSEECKSDVNQDNQSLVDPKAYTPPQYTDNIKEIVINRIIAGDNPFTIAQEQGMPSFRTIYDWAAKSGALADFARSKALETLAISQSGGDTTQDNALQVKSIQWLSSKLLPAEFGDSSTLRLADNEGGKLTLSNIIDQID
jgi:hypothetical protein